MLRSNRVRHAITASLIMGSLFAGTLFMVPEQADLRSVIVQGHDLASVRAAVQSVGGEITHELGIIHAVAAQLTKQQRASLAQVDGVLRLVVDRHVGVSNTVTIETVRDEFKSALWSNNDGTTNWANDWQELGENDGPSKGSVKIAKKKLQLKKGNKAIERMVDLSAADSATLSFDAQREGLDGATDFISLEVSADGGSNWEELDRFQGPDNDGSLTAKSYDLSTYASATTVLRFTTSGTMDKSDKFYLDNVEVSFDLAQEGGGSGVTLRALRQGL